MKSRLVLSLVLVLSGLGVFARPAASATLPSGAQVRTGRTVDIRAFERSVAGTYHVTFRRLVAADIDHDGDVDIIGSTDRDFVVWLNDGEGHLTSQSPTRPVAVDGLPRGTTWSEGARRPDESIQNNLPSPRLPGWYAHAPPKAVQAHDAISTAFRRADSVLGFRTPRAPPL